MSYISNLLKIIPSLKNLNYNQINLIKDQYSKIIEPFFKEIKKIELKIDNNVNEIKKVNNQYRDSLRNNIDNFINQNFSEQLISNESRQKISEEFVKSYDAIVAQSLRKTKNMFIKKIGKKEIETIDSLGKDEIRGPNEENLIRNELEIKNEIKSFNVEDKKTENIQELKKDSIKIQDQKEIKSSNVENTKDENKEERNKLQKNYIKNQKNQLEPILINKKPQSKLNDIKIQSPLKINNFSLKLNKKELKNISFKNKNSNASIINR